MPMVPACAALALWLCWFDFGARTTGRRGDGVRGAAVLAAAPDSAPVELWLTAGWFVALLPSKRCERFDEATGVSFLAPNLLSGARLCTEGSQF